MLSINLLMHLISTFKITPEGVMGKCHFIVKYQMKKETVELLFCFFYDLYEY